MSFKVEGVIIIPKFFVTSDIHSFYTPLKKALDDKFFDLLDKYAKKYGRNQALQYMLTDNNRHLIEVYGSDNTKTGFFSKYIQAFREMKSMRIREEISKYCEINWI